MNKNKLRFTRYTQKIKAFGQVSKLGACLEAFEKLEYYSNLLNKLENNRSIMADDDDAVERLQLKIEAIDRLAQYFKACNQQYRQTGAVTARVTPYWDEIIQKNITSKNTPFTSNDFNNLRRKKFFTSNRMKAIQSAKTFRPFTINGVTVTVSEGQIRVVFPSKPSPETLDALKASPLRLKWSRYQSAWVRKFTGQGEEYFRALQSALQKGGV